jgi:hypothetical protein
MKFSDITGDEFDALNKARFEAAVVDSIIARSGEYVTEMRNTMRRRVRSNGTDAWATFYDYWEEFPDRRTPAYLFIRKYRKIQDKIPFHVLVENFAKTEPAVDWIELVGETPVDWCGPRGVVFFWPYLRVGKTKDGGAMVLHNHEIVSTEVPGFYGRFSLPGVGELWLESLSQLLGRWQRQGFFSS